MEYKDVVLPIIRSLREVALAGWGNIEIMRNKTGRSHDVVTEIDHKVEEILKEKLATAYPAITFVGEEKGGDREAKTFWLVDPIDGTGDYVRGLPFSTIMLALIDGGQVIFSAIYDFIKDDMYWAERGKGAYKNNEPIHVSARSIKEAYIGIETRSYKKENQIYFGKIHEEAGFFNSVSAGWELSMVASGKLDARISFDGYGKDYDYSPGTLLISEAGGMVTNLHSDTYDYRNTNVIAANPKVHSALVEIFKNYQQPA